MVAKGREDKSHVLSIILAGGAGKRLFPLTKDRSKPAVPFGGKYRLIDVPISNCINSGLRKIFVLTQFNSASLNQHVTRTYRFDGYSHSFVEVLAAEQTMANPHWFQGTADAVRQHMVRFRERDDDYHLILAGDQLYRMDFDDLLLAHWRNGADVTVCVIPREEEAASEMGLLKMGTDGRIEQFREKPKGEALREMKTDTTAFGLSREESGKRPYLASMGIYLFRRAVLEELLSDPSSIDFGHQVIPAAIQNYNVHGFLFDGYWEDLGTIGAFYKANIGLTRRDSGFRFDVNSPIYTHARFLPPSRFERCDLEDSLVVEGSSLKGARVRNSILGVRSVVRQEVTLENTLMMGADYYEDSVHEMQNRERGIPNLGIGRGTFIRNAIIDKNAHIGDEARIANESGLQVFDGDGYYIRDGIVIVPKGGIIRNGTRI